MQIFQKSKNLPGAIYAQSNAALCLFQLGDDEGGKAELRGVARRAAGSIDARAALAAQYWYEGAQVRSLPFLGLCLGNEVFLSFSLRTG